ncbi:MAG: NAD(+) diphosphatase [Gemmatimonadetes bacterium]|nr:NAD(+) diphosphatase [Gemmatimonadota bacterium]
MSPDPWCIVFSGSRLLLRTLDGGVRLPNHEEVLSDLGADRLAGTRVPALITVASGPSAATFGLGDDVDAPAGYAFENLRVAYHLLTRDEFRAAGTARQKVEWYRTNGFCSRCGSVSHKHPEHEAMSCTACGQLHFARVAPAVIVLVQRDREVLLGRSRHFMEGVYSTLAGFVEPGESLEECIHREIEEEVGVRVGNLRYFSSQPHPFPNSLMVGFIADWISGEIRIDPVEIEDARWFTTDDLPVLPHPMSIARSLIDDFVRRTIP